MMLSNIGICLVTTRVAINGSVKPVMNYLKLLKSFNYKKEDVRKSLHLLLILN